MPASASKRLINHRHRRTRTVGIFLLSLVFPAIAMAFESPLPYEGGLKALEDSFTGTVPFVISLAGIVGCGAMLIFGGEISGFMRTMVFIVLVVAVIVQASSIITFLKGGAGGARASSAAHAIAESSIA
ncbi:TrbC/VirB2 family protein [Luteibacter jiangsuensis]